MWNMLPSIITDKHTRYKMISGSVKDDNMRNENVRCVLSNKYNRTALQGEGKELLGQGKLLSTSEMRAEVTEIP